MIKLKEVIHYTDTNAVEATWVDEITPAIEVPESQAPDTEGPDGEIIPGAITPAHTIPAVEVNVKCHSYADVQMGMLRADLGDDAAEYEELMALVESNIPPPPPPPDPAILLLQTRLAQARAFIASTEWLKTLDDTEVYAIPHAIVQARTRAAAFIADNS